MKSFADLNALADDPVVLEELAKLADPLLDALRHSPDPDAALVRFSRYLAARAAKVLFLQYLRDDPAALYLLIVLLGTSPFLSDILIRNPEYFHWLVSNLERSTPSVLDDERHLDQWLEKGAALNALKRLKRRHILRIAALDILDRATLQAVTAQLSDLADGVVERTLGIVAPQELAAENRDRLPGAFTVIGMGKLGGEELNYSSDIDLIYVYEPDDEEDPGAHRFFQRFARKVTAALADYTEEGYLYRVDLRLRPMGRSGNIAHSLDQVRQYYEMSAVTFERFALIKARPIAGNRELGWRFLDVVEPFVYRKYLDHAALEEIYQHKARADRTIQRSEAHRNVKLGRGGIREVELFTQVLQLTYGARHPEVKQRNTLAGLAALRHAGLIAETAHADLVRAYVFLRTVEHRLQIVQEQQTHSLPDSREELGICARRLRFDGADALEAALAAHRERVHETYRGLFERRPGTISFEARQFFRILGDELPEREALAYLRDAGFSDPARALVAVRALGQHASMESAPATARNVIANLLAACVPALARCGRPELVLVRLEQLAAGTGGAALLGRSLLENDALREMLIDVLDGGELLAQRLVRNPELLDSIDQPFPAIDALTQRFTDELSVMDRFDRAERMDRLRRFKRIEEFKIVTAWLVTRSLDRLQENLTALADSCTARSALWHAPTPPESHADSAGGAASWAVVALGKLGGTELTVHSDLDLVIVYEDERDASQSDLRWQTFVEQLQAFLAQPTREGFAYRIDTRLRPEGTKGALAIPFPAFLRYLEERAEPWERLAWTRARVVVGSRTLSERIVEAVDAFVYGPWEPRMPADMHRIRLRMERELAKEHASTFDFKVGKGGLADIDFLCELVQIREGRTRPQFRVAGTRRLLAALPPTDCITSDEVRQLRDAYRTLRTLEVIVRMDADTNTSSISADAPALDPFGRRMGLPDAPGERLLALYRETTECVRSIYTSVLERLGSA